MQQVAKQNVTQARDQHMTSSQTPLIQLLSGLHLGAEM